ncbi:MAG TPA: histidine kinase dimerization/phosphoacceptor domain -containing protein [Frateuria sp.]|uniref:sensor histidine kinase n=1 Tax=Frateuria sp. TaxID=2211372 RepID=UPI002D7F74B0|nr:histidine kinase dimerization/phosphoacceptor domain -containing protein [Frateuria sp.]HET6806499.1 histidine kinase dimerization/phosphoacceptor domain -containing protein [Frateuria sp.]
MDNLIVAVLSRKRPPALVGYLVSLVLVLAVQAFEYVFPPALHRYLPFLPVVFFAAVVFGRPIGLFTTLLSAVLGDGVAAFVLEHRAPGPEEVLFLALFVAVGVTASVLVESLRSAVCKLVDAEAETSLLLDELAHRTRNDLMMISSVLGLQAMRQTDPHARAALESAVARVRVIAEAQERLRKSGKQGEVEVASYLRALGHGLAELLRDVRPINVRVKASPLAVEASVAVSIGLIANELVTNAFKYAFPSGQGGTVQITLEAAEDGIVLSVADDGVGAPPAIKDGLGTRLVQLLASHLGGKVERVPVSSGHRVNVLLPIKSSAPAATSTGA